MVKLPGSSVAIACLLIRRAAEAAPTTMRRPTRRAPAPPGRRRGGASSAASGSGGASVSSGTGGDSGTGGGALSFENDIWPILTMPRDPPLSGRSDSCSGANGCHLGGAGGLVLPDSSTAYENLIDAPSSSELCADLLLVVASEPDASCFVVFYEQRLRDQLGWVNQAETDVVRAWVEEGAAP